MKMNPPWCRLAAAAALLLALPLSTASANLLANPGFEEEDLSGGSEDGQVGPTAALAWVQFGDNSPPAATRSRDDSMPRSGEWNFLMQTESDTSGFAGAFQEVAAAAGQELTFSVWAKVDDLADGTPGIDIGSNATPVRIRLEFHQSAVGAGSSEISRIELDLTPLITSEYQLFEVAGVAPAGTLKVRPALALSANNDAFYFDDATLVPEPASLALLSLGALALGRRR